MQYADAPQQFLQAEDPPNENNSMQQFDELGKTIQLLERENQSLKEQLMLLTADDGEKAAIINRWRNESSDLQKKVTEQDYLKEIVEEKRPILIFCNSNWNNGSGVSTSPSNR
jgi:predicted RNase H-like nuclease (RuvC/YqgF family)